MGIIKDSVDAVVTAINAGSYSQSFTAQKNYRPALTLDDRSLGVFVWPESYDRTVDTRGRLNWTTVRVSVYVRKGVTVPTGSANTSDVDSMLDLVDEIIAQITTAETSIVEISSEGAYDGGRLYNDSDFAVVITATIRKMV